MASIEGNPALSPSDGEGWRDKDKPVKRAGSMEGVERGTEPCRDCGMDVGFTASTCPHCGGVHLDIYEVGPETRILRAIRDDVNTIKTIIVVMLVVSLIGAVICAALIVGAASG